MKEIMIDIPDELYEKALKMAEERRITFDELCVTGVKRLFEGIEAPESDKNGRDS